MYARWDDPSDWMAPTLLLCLSVIDGPMVLVETPAAARDPTLAP
jgi:hypothetical protein